jgi:hypothetical protein
MPASAAAQYELGEMSGSCRRNQWKNSVEDPATDRATPIECCRAALSLSVAIMSAGRDQKASAR